MIHIFCTTACMHYFKVNSFNVLYSRLMVTYIPVTNPRENTMNTAAGHKGVTRWFDDYENDVNHTVCWHLQVSV